MMFSHGTHVLFWWRTPYKYEHTHPSFKQFHFHFHFSCECECGHFELWAKPLKLQLLGVCTAHTHTHVTPFNNCHHVLCYAHTTQYIKQELTCKIAFSLSVLNLLNNFSSGPQCMLLTEFQMVSRQNIQP